MSVAIQLVFVFLIGGALFGFWGWYFGYKSGYTQCYRDMEEEKEEAIKQARYYNEIFS